MLTLTPSAAAILAESRTRAGLPDHAVVRISGSAATNGQAASYQLNFVGQRAPDDIVVETHGTRVLVAAEVAEPLEEAVLDVEATAEGNQLVLKRNA